MLYHPGMGMVNGKEWMGSVLDERAVECLRWQLEYRMRQASEEDILCGVYLSSEKEASLLRDRSWKRAVKGVGCEHGDRTSRYMDDSQGQPWSVTVSRAAGAAGEGEGEGEGVGEVVDQSQGSSGGITHGGS